MVAVATAAWMGFWWVGKKGTVEGMQYMNDKEWKHCVVAGEDSSAVPGSLMAFPRHTSNIDCKFVNLAFTRRKNVD